MGGRAPRPDPPIQQDSAWHGASQQEQRPLLLLLARIQAARVVACACRVPPTPVPKTLGTGRMRLVVVAQTNACAHEQVRSRLHICGSKGSKVSKVTPVARGLLSTVIAY